MTKKKKYGYKPKTIKIKPFDEFPTYEAQGVKVDPDFKIKLQSIGDLAYPKK
tara:strand:+ start:330 stop:485 length:156 start_codon:yes stop_codon:yes gene_type:complete